MLLTGSVAVAGVVLRLRRRGGDGGNVVERRRRLSVHSMIKYYHLGNTLLLQGGMVVSIFVCEMGGSQS